MNKWIFSFFIMIALIDGLYNSYLPWFKPKEYLARLKDGKKKIHKIFPFFPNGFIDFVSYDWSPTFAIWEARIGLLLFNLICLLLLTAEILRPETH
jgi:hypothetical protein